MKYLGEKKTEHKYDIFNEFNKITNKQMLSKRILKKKYAIEKAAFLLSGMIGCSGKLVGSKLVYHYQDGGFDSHLRLWSILEEKKKSPVFLIFSVKQLLEL